MSVVSSEEYLERVSKLDTLINNKLIEVDQLYSLLTSVSVAADADRVQTSGDKDKIGNIVPKIVELKDEINRLIDSYVDEKQAIIQVIEMLPTLEYDVLHKIYIQDKSLQTVADEIGYSLRSVTNVKQRALLNLQKFI